jgi:hypothetical protein
MELSIDAVYFNRHSVNIYYYVENVDELFCESVWSADYKSWLKKKEKLNWVTEEPGESNSLIQETGTFTLSEYFEQTFHVENDAKEYLIECKAKEIENKIKQSNEYLTSTNGE